MPAPTLPRLPFASAVAAHAQRVLVFKGLVGIIYGSLWIHYLRRFWNTPDKAVSSHDGPDLHGPHTLCREVSPILRNVLTVVAWVQLIIGGAVCAWHATTLVTMPFDTRRMVLLFAQLVLLVVFVYQIQFLRRVARSDKTVGQVQAAPRASYKNDCHTIASEQQEVAWAYGWIVLLFGILFVLLGLTMQTAPST